MLFFGFDKSGRKEQLLPLFAHQRLRPCEMIGKDAGQCLGEKKHNHKISQAYFQQCQAACSLRYLMLLVPSYTPRQPHLQKLGTTT